MSACDATVDSLNEYRLLICTDFGGQKVFHAMHHLFITEYGLYLVVLDVTKIATPDMPKHLKFWLNSIKLHAPEAPVVLVGTHVDRLFNPYDVPLLSKKVEKMIGNTGLNFVCPEESIFFPVSNAINQGIDELRYAIDAAARRQDHVNALGMFVIRQHICILLFGCLIACKYSPDTVDNMLG